MTRVRGRLAMLAVGLGLTLALPGSAAAQPCPDVPPDSYAFISSTNDECPANPGVFWAAAQVDFECTSLAETDKQINCNDEPASCVGLCRAAAAAWNAVLPGRFTLVEASDPIEFCDTNDGRVSIGGTTTLCDGSKYGSRVLAVTLSIFSTAGSATGQLLDANITVNQRFGFSPAQFQATVAHELGHVLGLSHPDECGDDVNVLMRSSSSFFPQDPCFVRDPTAADINGAERIYPVVNPTPTPVATPGVCGDADLSGAVTVTDGVQTLRAAADLASSCTPARCDVDGSRTITVSDGVNVLRAAAGLSFPAACP